VPPLPLEERGLYDPYHRLPEARLELLAGPSGRGLTSLLRYGRLSDAEVRQFRHRIPGDTRRSDTGN